MSTAKQKDSQEKRELWGEVLVIWLFKKVSTMGLEEYANLNKSISFCYWLEK